MTLSIVIVNWNVKPLLERCLASITQNSRDLDHEVLVIDNNSTDGSRDYLRAMARKRKNLKVFLNKENLGFAKGNNQGIKEAQGEFILLLNPDTEVYVGTLKKMVNFMKKHQDCGIVGCKLVGSEDAVQPSVRSFPTPTSHLMIFLKFHYLFPNAKTLKHYFRYDFDYNKLSEVDQVMGAFLMTRGKIFKKLGLLDENFYLWFEEVDFCKRVKDAGWKIVYNPEVQLFHHGSQSFGQMFSLAKQRIYNRSAIYYFKKHFPFRSYWPLIAFRPVSLFLSYLTQVFHIAQKYESKRRTRFR